MNLTLVDLVSATVLFFILQFITAKWLESRLKASIDHEYAKKLEDYRGEIRRREQAVRVARLLAMQSSSDAREFNELA